MKSMLASMAVLTFCATPGAAAEFPKTGEAEYDMYYVDNVVAKIDSGAGTGAIVDITGITRNVKGEGPFHDMSVRCLGHQSLRGKIKVSQERFLHCGGASTTRQAAARPISSTTRPPGRSNN